MFPNIDNAIYNRAKQGGVLSPILYSVYVDDLIKILIKCNIGCRYNNEYMVIFIYTNDNSLLCPTHSGMQCMVRTCGNLFSKLLLKRLNVSCYIVFIVVQVIKLVIKEFWKHNVANDLCRCIKKIAC